ncbi:MAG TPA: hypothetical protein DCS67_02110 [Clostridiales bacterium UBA8960]|nr:hypothetical protein [Clostridiales bacterium UBA8960]
MKRIWRFTVLCLSVLTLFSGCGTLPVSKSKGIQKSEAAFTPQSIRTLTPELENSISASSRLGYDLMQVFAKGENTLISPISLSFALAMLLNGAEGETLDGILKVMGESSVEGLNTRYNGLLSSLTKSGDTSDDKSLTVLLGNSFWIRELLEPKQDFVDTLVKNYDAEVYKSDFSDPKTVDQINKWVEDKTNGLLKDTLDSISGETIAYLMNTVYFNGAWLYAYSPEATYDDSFYPIEGGAQSVKMMHQTRHLDYYEDDSVQVAAFPYHGGMTMKVVLPKEDLMSLMRDTSFETLESWLGATGETNARLYVSMPKFEYDVKNSLSEPLKALGMSLAFEPFRADFSSMVDIALQNVYVSDIFQNCKIINDEKGTEAAAVTVVEMVVTSAPVEVTPIDFNCNKPFLYVIEEDVTGAILFMGAVFKP